MYRESVGCWWWPAKGDGRKRNAMQLRGENGTVMMRIPEMKVVEPCRSRLRATIW